MSFQYLNRSQIDDAKWNRCIENAPEGTVYGYAWYLDSVAVDWDAIVYGDYKAVMPLPHNQKMGIRSVYPPIFAQQLGVFSETAIKAPFFFEFFQQIPAKRFHKIRLPLHSKSEGMVSGLHLLEEEFVIHKFNNYLLSLALPYTDIRQNYNSNTKRNLNKTKPVAFELRKDIAPQTSLDLFAQNKGTELNHPSAFYEAMKQIMQHSISLGIGENWGILLDGELLATGLWVNSHQKVYNLFPVNTGKGKETRALFYLFDQLIQANAGRPLTLDFEGSMVGGVARYYKGFGSQAETYWHFEQNRMPWYMKVGFEFYKAMKN